MDTFLTGHFPEGDFPEWTFSPYDIFPPIRQGKTLTMVYFRKPAYVIQKYQIPQKQSNEQN